MDRRMERRIDMDRRTERRMDMDRRTERRIDMDRRTERRMDMVIPIYLPQKTLFAGGIMNGNLTMHVSDKLSKSMKQHNHN